MWTGKSKERRRVDKQSKTERRRATETQSQSARQFSSLAAPQISISTTVVHESIQRNTYTHTHTATWKRYNILYEPTLPYPLRVYTSTTHNREERRYTRIEIPWCTWSMDAERETNETKKIEKRACRVWPITRVCDRRPPVGVVRGRRGPWALPDNWQEGDRTKKQRNGSIENGEEKWPKRSDDNVNTV